ncbi:alanine--tRNA ligase, partial [Fusarium albosuccineum]
MMSTRHLHPRKLTLTIRHADWWYWENDEPLRFEGNWIQDFCLELPSSLQQICIELESLERKKDQVDKIADQMVQRWFFKNLDGVVFLADTNPAARKVTRWSGSSTWHRQRWARDETEPGRIDYYVAAITFKPWTIIERNGGKVSEDAKYAGENDTFDE